MIGLHHESFRIVLKGKDRRALEAAADRFIVPFVRKWLHPVVWNECLVAKKRGEEICLLSSSADFLVERVAKCLGFHRWAGTEYSIDKAGRLCDILSLITGPGKLKTAKSWAEGSNVVAYSDSSDDLELLSWAGRAVAVQPDRALRKVAVKRGWSII